MERGNRKLQYAVTFAVSMASTTMGVLLNWITPVIPKFHEKFAPFNISESEISWLAAISSPGLVAGSLVSRYTLDHFGRRATILGSAVPTTMGTIMVLLSFNAWMICTGRFLWGCGSGMIASVSSIYLAEIVDKDIRGTVSLVLRFMLKFGSFIVMAVAPFVSFEALNYMLLVLPVSYFIACWWIPETPYYYLKEGKVNAARKELKRLKGYEDPTVLEENLSSMRSDVLKEMKRSSSLKELLTGKQYRKAVIIIIGLKVTQFMSGTVVIQQYLGRIIQESDSHMKISTVLIVYGAVRFIIGIVSSLLIDKIGRRSLLIYSYLACSIILTVTGGYFFFKEVIDSVNSSGSSYWFIPFYAIILFSIISGLGYDSVIYVVQAEIFPINVRSVAMTSVIIIGGSFNFISVKSYQHMKDVIGLRGVFWFYAAIALLGAVFTYFVVPETKGKSLKEIQIELQGNIYGESNEKQTYDDKDVGDEMKELKKSDISER